MEEIDKPCIYPADDAILDKENKEQKHPDNQIDRKNRVIKKQIDFMQMHIKTDGNIDRQIDRQIDRNIDRLIDKQTDRQIEILID